MQPPAARRPAEPRLSETIALLTPDATYTYSPSELTANPSGSQSPGAVPPRPAQSVPPVFWTQPAVLRAPPAPRAKLATASSPRATTYTFSPSGLTATPSGKSSGLALPPTPGHSW